VEVLIWSVSRYFGEYRLSITATDEWRTSHPGAFIALPLLEAKADKKWGGQADYEEYKKKTGVLLPKL